MTMKEKKTRRRSDGDGRSLRSATFARRSKGLLKKAYELSTLVGVDVCVVLLPPSGEDGGGCSSSSLHSPPPVTWPEQPSELLRIIHRFQSVDHGKRRNHRNQSSSTSFPSSALLQSPEEPSESDLLPSILVNGKQQNPQNCSPSPSSLLEENHRLKQELQKIRRQNLELAALCPSCDSIGTSNDVNPFLILDSTLDDSFPTISEEMKRSTEEKEFLEFFESLTPTKGDSNPTATHQGNQVVDIGQPLILDDLPPLPMTCSSSECWDFSFSQKYSPLYCSSQFQSSSVLEDEIRFFSGAFGASNALPGF